MEFYLYISNFLSVFPVNQPPLLDHESSTHVASIEVLKLHEVIVNIDKAQDECAENTNAQECEDDEDFFIVNIVPENIFLLLLSNMSMEVCAIKKQERL